MDFALVHSIIVTDNGCIYLYLKLVPSEAHIISISNMADLLSISAWASCLLGSGGESVDVLVEDLRKECVLRATSLVLPLAV